MSAALGALPTHAGRIGPNAITRLAEALPPLVGGELTREVFDAAGLLGYLGTPPQQMVEEAEVARLHRAARALLGAQVAGQAARRAGQLTADYLLAHRIPKPAQWLLRRLPAPIAARLLLKAVRQHAWTFCGSGRFEARAGRPVVLEIHDNPMCRGLQADDPACDFYAATFERLFRVLVHPATEVQETLCEARGDACCRFELRW